MEKSLSRIRQEFPILAREFNGYPLAYLDSAATTQTPRSVLFVQDQFYKTSYANVNRASYDLSSEASFLYRKARKRVARFIGGREEEIVFTKNATEAINLVASSWGEANIHPGDKIVLTEMEHHANIVPWYLLAEKRGAQIVWVGLEKDGSIDKESLSQALAQKPKLLSLTHVSNVLGTLNPVAEITKEAHSVGAQVLIDGAQAIPRISVDLSSLDADFYVFSGHKLYGPTGIGVLYGKKSILEDMPPFLGGGGMISSVKKERITFREAPERFEAGTPPIAEAIGLEAAINWIEGIGLNRIKDHEKHLTKYLLNELEEKEGIYLPGKSEREGIVSFSIQGVHAHDTSEILNRFGLSLRAGHHCAQILVNSLGVDSLVRASFAIYNTEEEVERLSEGIDEVQRIFK